MKKLFHVIVFVIIIIANGCHEESGVNFPTPQKPLSFIQFHDWTEFEKTVSSLENKDMQFLRDWENKMGYRSLKSIYEDAVEDEQKFLDEAVKKYGEGSNLTRRDLGYTKGTQELLDRNSLFLDEFEVIDMNVTLPKYAYVVNADGIVKIGNEIIQFKYNIVKKITDNDQGKIKLLPFYKETNESQNIIVEPLIRSHDVLYPRNLSNGKIKENTSCSDINDNYKLIGYEEHLQTGATWCGRGFGYNYYVRLRSLIRILGTWQNHKTNYLQVVSNNVKMVHYSKPQYSDDMSTWTIIGVLIDEMNVTHDLPYGHTETYYYIQNYPTDCFQPGVGRCGAIVMESSDITAKGKNATQCNVGHTWSYTVFSDYCQYYP
jgi:hypothetical protein